MCDRILGVENLSPIEVPFEILHLFDGKNLGVPPEPPAQKVPGDNLSSNRSLGSSGMPPSYLFIIKLLKICNFGAFRMSPELDI